MFVIIPVSPSNTNRAASSQMKMWHKNCFTAVHPMIAVGSILFVDQVFVTARMISRNHYKHMNTWNMWVSFNTNVQQSELILSGRISLFYNHFSVNSTFLLQTCCLLQKNNLLNAHQILKSNRNSLFISLFSSQQNTFPHEGEKGSFWVNYSFKPTDFFVWGTKTDLDSLVELFECSVG